ncbi:MAG: AMP-binding protein [Polyangiaceae bacterium]|nr:AMP-binding protein [Polyangiaceae bacterium]
MTTEANLRDRLGEAGRRWSAGRVVVRALARTVRSELREGTLRETLRASREAGTLSFAGEPTFGELLARRARERPDAEFVRFERQRVRVGELDQRVNAVAAGLRAVTRAGDNVALLCPNCPEYLEAFFAIQRLGLGAVPVNTALVGDGLVHVLQSSRARAAIVHHDQLAQLEAVRARAPELEHVVVITEGAPYEAGAGATLEGWRRDHRDAAPPARAPDPEAVALLLYTSGTTGSAKGVVYRYRDSNTKRLRLLSHLLYSPGEVLYTCLPLFHANALLLTTMMALDMGSVVALGRRFSASRFWQEAAELGATTFNALGAMIPILLKQPPGAHDRAHRVRLVVSAACPAEAWRPFEERFGVRIVEAYGAVDGGGFITMNLGNAPVGSIGKPLGGKYRLLDDAGGEARSGEPGELCVWMGRSESRKVEYYRDEKATRQKTHDGWLHTGDFLRRDERGFLYFVGRRSDSMRRRGENVSAHEVESVLAQHPDVLECAVFGVPSELGEDDIMAVVVPVEGRTLDPAEVRRYVEPRLARHAWPRYVELAAELPKTGTHRVQKSDLQRRGPGPATWDAERGAPR